MSLIKCPDCGGLVSSHFPLHGCREKRSRGEIKREEAWGAQVASLRKAYAKLKKERDQERKRLEERLNRVFENLRG